MLIFPDPKLPYTVVTDASGTATGGVLMQDQGDGPRPIAFMSRALKPTEQWYLAYERELAAMAYCFIQWRHYLEGCPGGVTVITDHQPLTHLMEQQVLSRLQSRVALAWVVSVYPAEDAISAGQSQYCRRCSFTESAQCQIRGICSARATKKPRCRSSV